MDIKQIYVTNCNQQNKMINQREGIAFRRRWLEKTFGPTKSFLAGTKLLGAPKVFFWHLSKKYCSGGQTIKAKPSLVTIQAHGWQKVCSRNWPPTKAAKTSKRIAKYSSISGQQAGDGSFQKSVHSPLQKSLSFTEGFLPFILLEKNFWTYQKVLSQKYCSGGQRIKTKPSLVTIQAHGWQKVCSRNWPLKNQKGLQNINQSPDIKPRTEVSKRAYTARCKRAFLSLKSFCHSSCWKKTFGPTKSFLGGTKTFGCSKSFFWHLSHTRPATARPAEARPDPERTDSDGTARPDPGTPCCCLANSRFQALNIFKCFHASADHFRGNLLTAHVDGLTALILIFADLWLWAYPFPNGRATLPNWILSAKRLKLGNINTWIKEVLCMFNIFQYIFNIFHIYTDLYRHSSHSSPMCDSLERRSTWTKSWISTRLPWHKHGITRPGETLTKTFVHSFIYSLIHHWQKRWATMPELVWILKHDMITSTISAREEKPSRKTDIATYWVASGHPAFALTSSNSHNFAEILRPWFWGQVHLFHPQLLSWCSQGTSAAWLPQPCSVHLNKRSLAQSRLGFQLSGYPAGQTKVNHSSRNRRRVCWLCFMIHDS